MKFPHRRGGRVETSLTSLEAQSLLFAASVVLDDQDYARSVLGGGVFLQAANRAHRKLSESLLEGKDE